MSYILEALKKSEQERRIGAVPDLSVMQESPSRPNPRWPNWLLGALLLNALILAFVAWRIWNGGGVGDAGQAASPPVVDSSTAKPAATARSTADAENAVEVQPPAMVPSDERAPAVVVAEAVDEAGGPATESRQTPTAPASQFDPAYPTDPDAPVLGPDLEPVAAFPAQAHVEASGAGSEEDVVRWEDLPSAQRSGLPVPRIDVHVFASEPERRFVLINLRKYLQGDRLDDGAVIETILADGIVLSYRGQRYRVDRP